MDQYPGTHRSLNLRAGFSGTKTTSAKIRAESAFILKVSCVPLHEYKCKKCKHKFEKIQKFSDRPLRKCPECGGPVEQLLHAPAVQFKGTGWYVTDYAGKKTDAQAVAASDGSSEKAEKAEKKDSAGSHKEKDKDSKPKKAESKKTKE
jgi:putative FmdB family regulatory protein